MSLNSQQRAITSRELQQNLELSGLSREQVAADLELSVERVDDALEMRPTTNGTTVWRLRDYLQERVEEQGKEPIPFTVLKTNRYFPYPR